MEQIYWSIDDFVGWRGKPDDDFWDVLATLRDQVLRGKIEMTGWRCSWDESGGDCDTDKVRRPIPALSIEDLKFGILSDNSDFVLIHHGSTWRSKSYGHIRMTEGEYDERFGPSDRDRIHGWRELRMRADQVRAVWRDTEPAADQIEKPKKRHVERGQINKVANEILEERKTDLVRTNGLLAAAQLIADQMEPSPKQTTVYTYIRVRYWELAEEMDVPKSPTSSKGKG